MNMKRIARHLMMTPGRVRRTFPQAALLAIEGAINATEQHHSGQIRFAVEGALDVTPLLRGQSARERAIDLFAQLRIWDTADNNGVLIYLLLADRDVEIVADRGIAEKIAAPAWEQICRTMESAFLRGEYEKGVLTGIHQVAHGLTRHFLARTDGGNGGGNGGGNELPDQAVLL